MCAAKPHKLKMRSPPEFSDWFKITYIPYRKEKFHGTDEVTRAKGQGADQT